MGSFGDTRADITSTFNLSQSSFVLFATSPVAATTAIAASAAAGVGARSLETLSTPIITSSSSISDWDEATSLPLSSSSLLSLPENNSFAFELPDLNAINRSLYLTGASASSAAIASIATNPSLPTSLYNTTLPEDYDFSNFNATDLVEWSHFYDLILSWKGICLISVFFVFIIITIIGNTLVILAVITTRRLKTVTNCFVMSLAVADLLVGIFVMPPAVAVHLIGSWQLGWILCDIWISLDVLLCTASILSLCAISVDRYLAVTQPLSYSRKRRSKRLALVMILIVWLLALAITSPPMFGWYEPGRRDLKECRYNQNEGYVIFSAMGSFFIPMAVMIYVYARISCVIASRHDNMTDISVHNKKFKRYTAADVDNDIDQYLSEQELSIGHKKQMTARTFSNQTISKELHEIILSDEGNNRKSSNGNGNGNGGGNAGNSGSVGGDVGSGASGGNENNGSSRKSVKCDGKANALGFFNFSKSATTASNKKNGCYELTRPTSLRRATGGSGKRLSPNTAIIIGNKPAGNDEIEYDTWSLGRTKGKRNSNPLAVTTAAIAYHDPSTITFQKGQPSSLITTMAGSERPVSSSEKSPNPIRYSRTFSFRKSEPPQMPHQHHQHHYHHQQHHLSVPASTTSYNGSNLLHTSSFSSALTQDTTLGSSRHLISSSSVSGGGIGSASRLHASHYHHHHPHAHSAVSTTAKSFSNRITSLKKENKTTQTLSIVVGGFIACWLPFFIYYLLAPFLPKQHYNETLAKGLTWLGWFNSAINPFIYAFYSVDFRAAFWRLTCKRFFNASPKQPYQTNTMSIRR